MKNTILNDFMNNMLASTAALCNDFALKCGAALVYAFYAFHFDTLQTAALQAVIMLVFFDMITGVFAAHLSGEKIRSRKLFASATKLFVYLLMISAAHFVEVAVPELSSFTDEAMIAFVALTEIVSVLENLARAGFHTPSRLIDKLKNLRDTNYGKPE